MRKVSVTSLYKNLSAELKDLPFMITSRGKTIAIVSLEESDPMPLEKNKPLEKKESVPNAGIFRPFSKNIQLGKK